MPIYSNSTLSNQYIPTFKLSEPLNGQVLVYDFASKSFINDDGSLLSIKIKSSNIADYAIKKQHLSASAGGEGSANNVLIVGPTGELKWAALVDIAVGDINLVNIGQLANVADSVDSASFGEYLIYNDTIGMWTNGRPSIDDMFNVDTLGKVENSTLLYNSISQRWEARKIDLNHIENINVVAPNANDVLSYNGIEWVSTPMAALSPVSLDDLVDVNATTGAKFYLGWNGSEWTGKQISYSDLSGTPSISGKADKVAGATVGRFASLDASGNLADSGFSATSFASAAQGLLANTALQPTASINALVDVNTVGAASGQVLSFNGASWVPSSVAAGGATTFLGLSDTPASYTGNDNKIVKVSGSSLVFGASINDLVDVSSVGATNGQVLTYNGSDWVPGTPTATAASGVEWIRVDYNLDGTVTSVAANVSSRSTNINNVVFVTTTASNITINVSFNGYNQPPANVMYYGYDYTNNRYSMKQNTGISGNFISPGGLSGTPGNIMNSFSTMSLTNKIDRSETGASNGAGFPGSATHAYIVWKF